MRSLFKFGLICLLLLPMMLFAGGPSRLKVVREIEINAPAEKVWEMISDYCSIKDWNPAVTGCENNNGTQPDSVRTLTLNNGEQFREKLINHNADQLKYQYMLLEPNSKALPITTYGSTLTVKSGDNGTAVVEWKGAFYRSFPGPNPPPELSDEAAIQAVSEFYTAGLENIKKLSE